MAYVLGSAISGGAAPAARGFLRGAPSGGPSGAAARPSPQQDLDARRAGLDSRFQQIYAALQGQDVPFTPEVIASLFGQAAGAASGAARGQQNYIRDSFAARGIGGGSGAELGQLLQAQNRANAQLSRAQSGINTTAALENYGAKERALAGMRDLLGQELGYQSRMEALQNDELTRAVQDELARTGAGSFGGGGFGGGGGGGAFAGGGGGGWDEQWAAENAQNEARAAQLRQEHAASYDPTRPVGTRAGYKPAGSSGGPNPFGGLLGLAWGNGQDTGAGGVPVAYGGVGLPESFARLASSGDNPAYAGAGGGFSWQGGSPMRGTPEQILAQLQRPPATPPTFGGVPVAAGGFMLPSTQPAQGGYGLTSQAPPNRYAGPGPASRANVTSSSKRTTYPMLPRGPV